MFSDIADFTSIAESLSEGDLLLLLTRYLSVMSVIAETYHGEVAEILGDGLLIFWNTPEDVEDHADKACMAALAMQAAIPMLNEQLIDSDLPPLSIRVGIHTGSVLSGLIGSAHRLKFGCMGDPVNLASRVEGLCKFFGVGILCSGDTVTNTMSDEQFIFRRVGCVQVKGKSDPTMMYEIMGVEAESPHEVAVIATMSMKSSSTVKEADHGTRSHDTKSSNVGSQLRRATVSQFMGVKSGSGDNLVLNVSSPVVRVTTQQIDEEAPEVEQDTFDPYAAVWQKSVVTDFEASLELFEQGNLQSALQAVACFLQRRPCDGPAKRLYSLISDALKAQHEAEQNSSANAVSGGVSAPQCYRVIKVDEK
eukprot:TRINITY_DN23566_c0_g1_i1.p1 TRINITY_DN23566_c0_g1~~TRINITY_DN23566_c0_g1_i1.p1  ORF type:complete len:401 (+),score=63.42 TRINITY_DN23566_c0_g1_i1:114-1205(+)